MRTKLLAIFLILAMSLSLFVACANTEEETNEGTREENTTNGEVTPVGSSSETVTEVETLPLPDIEMNDYGEEFYLWISSDSNAAHYHWVEESKGDTMTEAVYNRQEQVRQYLGVEIVGQSKGGGSQTYLDEFKTAVKNKDGSVHLFVTHVFGGLAGMSSGGYLTPYESMPAIDLDADYWSSDVMEALSVEGKTYLGKSRFNILFTYIVAFNKGLMAQYEDSLDSSVYEMVNNYKWTLDQMIALSDMAYVDATADGKTGDDTFGLSDSNNVCFIGFLHSSNVSLIEQDEKGAYKVSVYNEINAEKTVSIVEKLKTLVNSDSCWMLTDSGDPRYIDMSTGRVLMTLEGTNSLEKLTTYDLTFGVLPYPMYDEAQKDVGYRHLQWGGYLAIPSYLTNTQMVGETVEMLSYYSTAVNDAYYEKMLGKQASDMPEDRAMLNLVWDTLCSDFGQPYCELDGGRNILYLVPGQLVDTTGAGVASYVASNEKALNKAIEKFIKIIGKQ